MRQDQLALATGVGRRFVIDLVAPVIENDGNF
jgi:hypothetical protein